jgi:hypothetical protein
MKSLSLFLTCEHFNSGTNLRECEVKSWFNVQAVPVFRFDWLKIFSRSPGVRVPQVEDRWCTVAGSRRDLQLSGLSRHSLFCVNPELFFRSLFLFHRESNYGHIVSPFFWLYQSAFFWNFSTNWSIFTKSYTCLVDTKKCGSRLIFSSMMFMLSFIKFCKLVQSCIGPGGGGGTDADAHKHTRQTMNRPFP